MLNRNAVITRYILSLFFFSLSAAGILTGWSAAVSAVLGTIELTTALMRYSPLLEIRLYLNEKRMNDTIY